MNSPSSRHRTPTQVLSLTTIEQARSALQALAQTPRDRVTLREAIAQLEASIQTAFDKGYSRADVVDLLNQVGIPVSLSSLRYHLTNASSPSPDLETLDGEADVASPRLRSLPPTEVKPQPSLAAALQTPRSPANRQHVEDVITYLLEE